MNLKKLLVNICFFVFSRVLPCEKTSYLYGAILMEKQPERALYLAVPETAYDGIFSRPVVNRLVKSLKIRFILFNEVEGRVTQWIDKKNTKKSSEK